MLYFITLTFKVSTLDHSVTHLIIKKMISKYFKTYINELYIRGFFLIGCITLIIIILLNFIEFINNYFYFFSEIQVNELEYYYYNNNYYNNTVLTYTNYEYD